MNNMIMKLFMSLIEYICGVPEQIYQENYKEVDTCYFLYDMETQEENPLYN